jgi:hypothetical protein
MKLSDPQTNSTGTQPYSRKGNTGETEYNGWKNYASWNVMLHIDNDYGIYTGAVKFMSDYKGKRPYIDFCKDSGLETQKTPDRINWISAKLDYEALNSAMWELAPEGARRVQ